MTSNLVRGQGSSWIVEPVEDEEEEKTVKSALQQNTRT
jgi:hypothetical protein